MADLIDELRNDGEAAIDRWIRDKQAETLHFDCKQKANPAKPKLDPKDRKNLGKALSAFANSDGGLLLWGVDARGRDGIDRLLSKMHIAQLAAFRSSVEHAISEVINPPIPDLEFVEVPSTMDEGAGYLAISVPSSERRPHMSRNNDEPGFYFRNGHQSVLMEVFQVRDQMLRRAVPRLEFEWDVRTPDEGINRGNVKRASVPVSFELILKNNSSVSARFPYLIVRVDRGRYMNMGAPYSDFASKGIPIERLGPIEKRKIVVSLPSVSQDWEFAGGADCCIHPGTALRIAAARLEAPAHVDSHYVDSTLSHTLLQPRYGELPTVIMEVSYGCLDAPCERFPLEVKGDQMQAKFLANGEGGPFVIK